MTDATANQYSKASPGTAARATMDSGTEKKGEGSQSPAPEYEEVANPFRLPSDEEVFVTREAEKRRTQELKEKQMQLKIWEKTTTSTHAPLKRPKETDIPPADFKAEMGEKKQKKRKELIQAALDIVKGRTHGSSGKDLGEKKQGMQEFIDQKKDMFLVMKTTKILKDEKKNLKKMADERALSLKELAFFEIDSGTN